MTILLFVGLYSQKYMHSQKQYIHTAYILIIINYYNTYPYLYMPTWRNDVVQCMVALECTLVVTGVGVGTAQKGEGESDYSGSCFHVY